MIGDLLSNPLGKPWSVAPRALLVASIALVVGFAGVGTGRALDRKSAVSHAQSTASTELMHDISTADEQVHHSLAMPEMVTAIHHTRIITMEVTAYCACPKCCGPKASGITASGKLISYNGGKFVAADTSVLPFGTKLLIPGYDNKPVEVIDKGGAIKGNKLDVFFSSHEEARRWGRRQIQVAVVE